MRERSILIVYEAMGILPHVKYWIRKAESIAAEGIGLFRLQDFARWFQMTAPSAEI